MQCMSLCVHTPLCLGLRLSAPVHRSVSANGPGTIKAQLHSLFRQSYSRPLLDELCCRFNLMNNWRRFKEKLTIWVIRFSTEARMKYWGLTNLSAVDARNVVGLLKASCSPVCSCSARRPTVRHLEYELQHELSSSTFRIR